MVLVVGGWWAYDGGETIRVRTSYNNTSSIHI